MAQAINRYFRREAAQPEFYQEPLDVLAVALDAKQKRYDEGLALADTLYQTQIKALPQDRARADALISGYQSRIDDIVEQAGGDYSSIQPELYRLKRDIFRDFSPGGEAESIQTMFGRYNAALEAERKRIGKDITADQLGSLMSWFNKEYQGIGTKDPVTGAYTGMMELPSIAKYVDVNDLVTEYGKEIIANKMKNVDPNNPQLGQWFQQNGKIWTKTSLGIEEVDPERVRSVIMQGLASNDEFINYAQQMSDFGSPLDEQRLNMAINRGVETFGYRNVEFDQDMKFDPYALFRYRQSLRDQSLKNFLTRDIPVRTMPGPIMNTRFGNLLKTTDPNPFTPTKGSGPGTAVPFAAMGYEGKEDMYNPDLSFGHNYKTLYDKVSENSPALKGIAEDLYKEVARDPNLKTSKERWDAFAKKWDESLSNLQSTATTAIGLPNSYVDNMKTIWPQQARAGQWYEIGKDGTTRLVDKEDLGSEFLGNPPLPVGIQSMGDKIGYWIPASDGKQYIVAGVDDQLTAKLDPVMRLHSPLITGQEGKATLYDENGPYQVRSSVALWEGTGEAYVRLDRYNPSTGKWIQVKYPDGTPVPGEMVIDRLQRDAAGQIFRNSDLNQNVLRFGEATGAFDIPGYTDRIETD